MSLNGTETSYFEMGFWASLALTDLVCLFVAVISQRRHRSFNKFPFNFFFLQTLCGLMASLSFLSFITSRALCSIYKCPSFIAVLTLTPYYYTELTAYFFSILLAIGLAFFIIRPFDGGAGVSKTIIWVFAVTVPVAVATVALDYRFVDNSLWSIVDEANFTDYTFYVLVGTSILSMIFAAYKLSTLQGTKTLIKIKRKILLQYVFMLCIYLTTWISTFAALMVMYYVDDDTRSVQMKKFLFYIGNFDDMFFGLFTYFGWFFFRNLRAPLVNTMKGLISCHFNDESEIDEDIQSKNAPLVEKYNDISDLNILFQRNLLACSVYGISKSIEDINLWSHVTLDKNSDVARSLLKETLTSENSSRGLFGIQEDFAHYQDDHTFSDVDYSFLNTQFDTFANNENNNENNENNNENDENNTNENTPIIMKRQRNNNSSRYSNASFKSNSDYNKITYIKRKYDFSQINNGLSVDPELFYLSNFQIITMCPELFYHIRLIRGISHELYQKDLEPNSFLKSVISTVNESEFFSFSRKKLLIVRTITQQQYEFFQSIFMKYYEYMIHNENTLLLNIFGCYKLRVNGVVVHIIVMENVFFGFESDNEEQKITSFDLSGYERPKSNEILREYRNTLRDQDIINIGHPFSLSYEHRRKLSSQILIDSNFLASLGIIDYRLLCGVITQYDFGPMEKKFYLRDRRTKRPNLFFYHDRVYMFGIINFLDNYSFSKKVQSFAEKMLCVGDKVLDPESYQSRFQEAMVRYFKLKDAKNYSEMTDYSQSNEDSISSLSVI